jgi:DNA-binding CsgD family transcriptional regulator
MKHEQMSKFIDSSNTAVKVIEISQQLFTTLPQIKAFAYSRIYQNGCRIKLSSSSKMLKPSYLEFFFMRNFNRAMLDKSAVKDFMVVSEWLKSLNGLDEEFYRGLIQSEHQLFDFQDEACLLNFYVDFIEVFHYYCSKDTPNPVNFFIGNRKILQQFAIKFVHDGKGLIENEIFKNLPQLDNHDSSMRIRCISHNVAAPLLPKRFYVGHKNHIYLTHSELKCGIEALNGKSNQQIADSMGISVRTVEVYMRAMCKKIGCERRSGVIQYLLKQSMSVYLNVVPVCDTLASNQNELKKFYSSF